jgi:hypothetical protein
VCEDRIERDPQGFSFYFAISASNNAPQQMKDAKRDKKHPCVEGNRGAA